MRRPRRWQSPRIRSASSMDLSSREATAEGTLQIPMSGRCESLNAAVAAAVLLWEGCR